MFETRSTPTRRRWLESTVLLTLGTALGANYLQSRKLSPTKTASPPQSPLENESPTTLTSKPEIPSPQKKLSYQDFLANFHFRHIQPHEVISPHHQTTRGITNSLPPIELWPAMPATLFVADEIRERLNRPLTLITSAYRSPAYNKACRGASQSWHTKNCALDLVFEGSSRDSYQIATELRKEGFFTGGIGLYNTFIHIDTRGQNATWRG